MASHHVYGFSVLQFDGLVWRELIPGNFQELGRMDSIPRQKAMKSMGRRIPGFARIDHKNLSTTAPQNQGCAEPRRATPHNHDINHVNKVGRDLYRSQRRTRRKIKFCDLYVLL